MAGGGSKKLKGMGGKFYKGFFGPAMAMQAKSARDGTDPNWLASRHNATLGGSSIQTMKDLGWMGKPETEDTAAEEQESTGKTGGRYPGRLTNRRFRGMGGGKLGG